MSGLLGFQIWKCLKIDSERVVFDLMAFVISLFFRSLLISLHNAARGHEVIDLLFK